MHEKDKEPIEVGRLHGRRAADYVLRANSSARARHTRSAPPASGPAEATVATVRGDARLGSPRQHGGETWLT
jgi:hypothetical protein